MESEEGYIDSVRSLSPNAEISDFKIRNLQYPDSDLVSSFKFKISNGAQLAGDEIIFSPYQLQTGFKNPFYSSERKFPIDFGCPNIYNFSMTLNIPEGYSVVEKPADNIINLGKGEGKYEFSCREAGNNLEIRSELNIYKTVFQPAEYLTIQKFYLNIQKKQSEFIVLKKNTLTKQNK
jgi:hypothetical protein